MFDDFNPQNKEGKKEENKEEKKEEEKDDEKPEEDDPDEEGYVDLGLPSADEYKRRLEKAIGF